MTDVDQIENLENAINNATDTYLEYDGNMLNNNMNLEKYINLLTPRKDIDTNGNINTNINKEIEIEKETNQSPNTEMYANQEETFEMGTSNNYILSTNNINNLFLYPCLNSTDFNNSLNSCKKTNPGNESTYACPQIYNRCNDDIYFDEDNVTVNSSLAKNTIQTIIPTTDNLLHKKEIENKNYNNIQLKENTTIVTNQQKNNEKILEDKNMFEFDLNEWYLSKNSHLFKESIHKEIEKKTNEIKDIDTVDIENNYKCSLINFTPSDSFNHDDNLFKDTPPSSINKLRHNECALTNDFFKTVKSINLKINEKQNNLKEVVSHLINIVNNSDFENRINNLVELSDQNSESIDNFKLKSEDCIRKCRKFETTSENLTGECINTLTQASICYAEWVCLHSCDITENEKDLKDIQLFIELSSVNN